MQDAADRGDEYALPSGRSFAAGRHCTRTCMNSTAIRTNSTSTVKTPATAPALVARAAQLGVDLPICAAVAELVRGRVTVQEAVARLLARPQRDE